MLRAEEDEAEKDGDERRADGEADGAEAEEDEAADAAPAGDGAAEESLPDAAQPEEAAEPAGTRVLMCWRASYWILQIGLPQGLLLWSPERC